MFLTVFGFIKAFGLVAFIVIVGLLFVFAAPVLIFVGMCFLAGIVLIALAFPKEADNGDEGKG